MVQLVLRDGGAADARRRRRRARDRGLHREPGGSGRSGAAAGRAGSGGRRADRARRLAPTSGPSARRSPASDAEARVRRGPPRDRLGRGPRRRGRVRLARHRGRRDRLPRVRRAGDPRRRPQPGSTLKLYTYHLVREDQQALFGFRTPEDLGFFTLLLTVTGVGPKVALAIVGSRPTPDLQLAIMAQDQAVLVSIPGIGKKLAERIIFELKEKVAAAGIAARAAGGAVAGVGAAESEVVGGAPGPRLLAGRGPRGVADRARRRRRSAARSRIGSRPRCGACSATEPARSPQPIRRCLMRVASPANGPSPTA